jgi:hypothetical protein
MSSIGYGGVMGTKRLRRQQRETVEERVRLLTQSRGGIASNGVRLKPGTPEYRQALEKMASMLSEEEFQSLVSSAAGASRDGLTRRRPRPT